MTQRLTFEAAYALDGNSLSGVAHVFGQTAVKGGSRVRFDPHAFDKSIARKAVVAFYSHDTSKPLAAQSVNTLDLAIIDRRLKFRMELGNQSYANDLRENHAAGLMNSMSFGVYPVQSEIKKDPDTGETFRLYTEAELFDISPVAIPAFDGTETMLHSADIEYRADVLVRARHRARRATWAT